MAGSVRSQQMELELQHYWRVMRCPIGEMSLTEYKDELEVIAQMTDWERMRTTAHENLSRFRVLGQSTKRQTLRTSG